MTSAGPRRRELAVLTIRFSDIAARLTHMLSDADLDAIEARCAAASPGPWTSPDMHVSRAEA